MNLKNVEKLEKNMVAVTVEVSKEEFEVAIDKAYKEQVKKLNIPGFRKGKAPRKVVEGMFGVEIFFDDAMNYAFPDAYQAAVTEAKMEPVGYPQVDVQECTIDGFTFKATFANYPEVKLGEYKGVSAEKPSAEVSDEDIDKKIKEMAERNARLVSVDRAVENGDTAVIDFEGFKDDVAFDGGKGENFSLEIGSGTFIPGFEEQVVGMKVDEEKDINVTFPEEYQAEDLAGKPVVFKVKVHEVKVKELPAMDDEFAKDVSEFDTLDALKADLRKKEEEKAKEASERAFENNAMEQVTANMECEIPQAMIDTQVNSIMQEYKMQITSQGISFDQYLSMVGTTEDDLRLTAVEPALHQLRNNLALEAIIKAENIEVTEDEVAAEFDKMAEKYDMKLEDVKKYLKVENVEEQLKREKAVNIVTSSAKVENK